MVLCRTRALIETSRLRAEATLGVPPLRISTLLTPVLRVTDDIQNGHIRRKEAHPIFNSAGAKEL